MIVTASTPGVDTSPRAMGTATVVSNAPILPFIAVAAPILTHGPVVQWLGHDTVPGRYWLAWFAIGRLFGAEALCALAAWRHPWARGIGYGALASAALLPVLEFLIRIGLRFGTC